MYDRAELLIELCRLIPRLDEADTNRLHKPFDGAIAICASLLELTTAQTLPATTRAGLATAISTSLTDSDRKPLLKKWDPQRRKDNTLSQTEIATALTALLDGQIDPYKKSAPSLAEARGLPGEARERLADDIRKRAPDADLKALLKKWDPHGAATANMTERIDRLLALLEGAEPAAAPPRSSRRNTRRT